MQEYLDEKEGRILATHAPYQILQDSPDSCDCKIVYVTRNPKDTLISMWRFVQKLDAVAVAVGDDPWRLWISYYDHVLGYRDESLRRPQKVMFVTYEELKEDTKSHVRRIGEFLGCPFGGEEEVEKIVERCSFDILSNQEINKSSELPCRIEWIPLAV
ncbi:hypothetical protein SASPL_117525 [Salvia splendens]|uniref:Sulfotransferase n=1 Tax=Salvia splendens TaxID=180675 RepID=A0A8X8XXP6_SALSN|nr:hypothetical protein SASPL_117525 [Salvia splendens]